MTSFSSESNMISYRGDLTRSAWMSGPGAEMYTAYYKKLVEETPLQAVPFSSRSDRSGLAEVLIDSADYTTVRFAKTENTWKAEEHPLLSKASDIMRFTSVEEFSGFDGSLVRTSKAINEHNGDSLRFAHKVTAALVHEAVLVSTPGLQAPNVKDVYILQRTKAVMRNQTFIKTISDLAITGFSVLGSNNAPSSSNNLTLMNIRSQLDLDPEKPSVVVSASDIAQVAVSEMTFELEPTLKQQLVGQLRSQNREMQSGDGGQITMYDLQVRMKGKPGFSRGCPVAHTGAFDLMTGYMADTVELTATKLPLPSARL